MAILAQIQLGRREREKAGTTASATTTTPLTPKEGLNGPPDYFYLPER
jgi:hypothetical protein